MVECYDDYERELKGALISALSDEERATRTALHINAYFTASAVFLEVPTSPISVESYVYLSACDCLGKLIEKDAAITITQNYERQFVAQLLSSARRILNKETSK